MSWKLYRWIWQVMSPLYLGVPPAGALNRTRLYIPARTFYGALTAEIARLQQPNQFPNYWATKQQLREHVRLSYLFPATQQKREWTVWLPYYSDGLQWQQYRGHMRLCCMDDRSFRKHLLIVRPGTAIEPESDVVATGTLREFELISTHWRSDDGIYPLAMVGYLFCKQGYYDMLSHVDELFVGGDTRYGLGRLQRISVEDTDSFFSDATLELRCESPKVTTSCIFAHAHVQTAADFIGAMECLSSWYTVQGGPEHAALVWVPGSRAVSRHQEERRTFTIHADGLWHLL